MTLKPILFLAALALTALAPFARAEDIDLSTLKTPNGTPAQKVDDGVQISGNPKLFTPKKFTTPFTIKAVLKTDSSNIRLCFGSKGLLMLSWPKQGKTLRFSDPRDGSNQDIANVGAIPKNQFITVLWTFENKQVSVVVNGELRATFPGDYANITQPVGVATGGTATVILKSLAVLPPQAPPAPRNNNIIINLNEPTPVALDISVQSGKHVDSPAAPAPADPNAIERPEFANTPKPLLKSVTSVTAMMVNIDDDGTEHGLTSDIIATVQPQSRHSNKSGVGFAIPDGDYTMKTAFSEAVRAVTLRYPIWEPGHIDVSFGEKFVPHGGPSAGTAFALLMLSTLEGFSLDPKCAVTGDITVDWKVRKIGGVTAKLHGATLDNCTCAAIPTENASALADMALLYGSSSLANIQIFSIATLQDAVAITRTDRAPQLTEAMKLFTDLQPRLIDPVLLKSDATQSALKHILELAPNHASAKYLLEIATGAAPQSLSSAATLHELSIILHPYGEILSDRPSNGKFSVPSALSAIAHKRIDALRPLASHEFSPVLTQVSAFLDTMDKISNHAAPLSALKPSMEALSASFAAVSTDKDFMENLSRDGF